MKPYEAKDTFLTTAYRGGQIHTCRIISSGAEEVKATLPNGLVRHPKTLRGAKLLISRHIGGRPHASYKPER